MRAIEEALDPRIAARVLAEVVPGADVPVLDLSSSRTIVLAGHRASGKSRLLPIIAGLLGRPGCDLDREIERTHGRAIREWFRVDPQGFRSAEREAFMTRPRGEVVAVGGGFLALHSDLLAGHLTVLVPVTFETYRERLLADTTRPRLRLDLPVEEELAQTFREREALHARAPAVSLAQFLRAALHGAAS